MEFALYKSHFCFLTDCVLATQPDQQQKQNVPNTSAVQTVSNPRKQTILICCLWAEEY